MSRRLAAAIALLCSGCADAIPVRVWTGERQCVKDAVEDAAVFWNDHGITLVPTPAASRSCRPGSICVTEDASEVPAGKVGIAKPRWRRFEIAIVDCFATRKYTMTVVAHEIGHAMRLLHVRGRHTERNLMNRRSKGTELTKSQVRRALRSFRTAMMRWDIR